MFKVFTLEQREQREKWRKKMSDIFREISQSQKKAIRFLKTELATGAKEVRALQTLARTQSIYPRTLTSARKILNIRVFRERQRGAFLWELPE